MTTARADAQGMLPLDLHRSITERVQLAREQLAHVESLERAFWAIEERKNQRKAALAALRRPT